MFCTHAKPIRLHFLIKCNGIHSSTVSNGSRQVGNAMRKVIGGSKKKKFHFVEEPTMLNPEGFSKGSFEGKSSGSSRRATVLNKLFMKHISDQMATGQCSNMILGHGVEINRVKVTPDYKFLRVYWTANSTVSLLETILQQCAGILRHELSQLRLMGNVPVIKFIHDKHYSSIMELDNRLKMADFGDDHIPLSLTDKLKTELELSVPLDTNTKDKLKDLDDQKSNLVEDLPIPPMPQNVFGINHADILNRINMSIKKSKALHRLEVIKNEEPVLTKTVNTDPLSLGDSKSERAAFKEFLYKRELLRLKARSEDRHNQHDMIQLDEMVENELNLYKQDLEDAEEDFIYEDIDLEEKK